MPPFVDINDDNDVLLNPVTQGLVDHAAKS